MLTTLARLGCVLAVGTVCGIETVVAEQFRVASHDLRLALDLEVIRSGLARLEGLEYRGQVHGVKHCNKGAIFAEIHGKPTLSAVRKTNWFDGRYGSTLDLRAKFQTTLDTTRCDTTVGTKCGLKAWAGPMAGLNSIPLQGKCRVQINFPFFPDPVFRFHPEIELPVELSDKIEFTLEQPLPQGKDHTKFEFGQFDRLGQWVSEGTTRFVPVTVNMASLSDVDSPWVTDRYLIADASIGVRSSKTVWRSQQQAEAMLRRDLPLWDDSTLGLSISETFFGRTKATEVRQGLFGHLLPIRVYGQKEYKVLFWKRMAEFEVFLDQAAAKVVQQDGEQFVEITLGTSKATIRDSKSGVGIFLRRGLVREVSAIVRLAVPTLDPRSGEVKFPVDKFTLVIDACIGVFCVNISPRDLEKTLNNGSVSIARLRDEVGLGIPDCIATGIKDNITSPRSCDNKLPRKGSISLGNPEKIPVFKFDFAGAKFRIRESTLQLGIPVSLKPQSIHSANSSDQVRSAYGNKD